MTELIDLAAGVPWWAWPLVALWYAFAWWLIRFRLMRLPFHHFGHVRRDDAVLFWAMSPVFGFCAAVVAALAVVMLPAYLVSRVAGPVLFGRD